jgi:hypothetical protein
MKKFATDLHRFSQMLILCVLCVLCGYQVEEK